MLWNRSLEKSINRGAGKTREARQFVFLSFLKRMFDVVLMRKEIACLTVFCLGLSLQGLLNAQEAPPTQNRCISDLKYVWPTCCLMLYFKKT
jgi:hypothetical protein